MAKIITDKQTHIVEHPKFKELRVHCVLPEPLEYMEMFSSFQKYQKHVAILHPITGELIKNEDRSVATQIVTNLPASAIMQILEAVIDKEKGWEGLEGSSGIITYSSSNIKHLFNRALNVPITVKRMISGVEKEIQDEQSFADYIQAEINKKMDGTNDIAPKAKTSPKRV